MLRNVKIDLLRPIALFAGCSKRELGEIARIADEIDFEAGKVLITQGEPGKQCFVVIEGSVEVAKDGKTLPALVGGTEIFGEIALLSGGPATASVITTTPVRALVIGPQQFQALLDRSPSIQRRVLFAMSQRLAPHLI
jgi:CRP-like cAMP-binding protein